jgi:hypothetical protein
MASLVASLMVIAAAPSGHARTPEPVIHHTLRVELAPSAGTLRVTDLITLPAPTDVVDFTLHPDLTITDIGDNAALERLAGPHAAGPWAAYRIRLTRSARSVSLTYGGPIAHDIRGEERVYDGGIPGTLGLISSQGVYLGPETRWYPSLGSDPVSFALTVAIPPGWAAVSQGAGGAEPGPDDLWGWREDHPQEGIWLIAGQYHTFERGPAQVFLRTDEPALAEPYLAATREYLDLYGRLIGPYPYAKFALVENFWETGYGMPSFTLIGPRVLRLPFIVHTSYPHELLHNWWGNGVYIDFGEGNWSEGLTSYLADHLLEERRGEGATHRRRVLQRYRDFTDAERDFPLREFRGRHDGTTQAIGYGKVLMVFHMLRVEFGDAAFVQALRRFWAENRFREAGWTEVRAAFEASAKADLGAWLAQWLDRAGAPALGVEDVQVAKAADGFQLGFDLLQTQPGPAYALTVPIVVHGSDGPMLSRSVATRGVRTPVTLTLPEAPTSLEIDPAFDVFRRLHPSEVPPALSSLIGAREVLMILPSDAPAPLRAGYETLARTWARGETDFTIAWDADIERLPENAAVWIIGRQNRLLPRFLAQLGERATIQANALHIDADTFPLDAHSVVLVAGRGDGVPMAWLSAHDPRAIAGLTRKLPHYGRYGYLIFAGAEPTNLVKGEWSSGASPLHVALGAHPPQGGLPPRPPLTAVLDTLGPAPADP